MGMAESSMLSTLLSQMPEHLPGGVMIYRDDEKEEILYANRWLIDMFGCSSFDDFWEVTGGSFHMLVHPDDVERTKKDIRDQVTGSRDKMDFVNYRIRRKDGSINGWRSSAAVYSFLPWGLCFTCSSWIMIRSTGFTILIRSPDFRGRPVSCSTQP